MKKPILTMVCALALLTGCASSKPVAPEDAAPVNTASLRDALQRIDSPVSYTHLRAHET